MRTNKILTLLMALTVMLGLNACASKKAVTSDSNYRPSDSRAAVIADALGSYKDWNSCRISGKLKMASLPVKPSLKIYMERGKELTISASAIFVGEVFRAELTQDSLFIVNKLKKTYCKESSEKLQEIYPTACEEVQSLLLGRMVVPGSGVLSERNIDKVLVEMENDLRKVSPKLGELPLELAIYYLLNNDGRLADLIVEAASGSPLLALAYNWKGNGGVDILANIRKNNKPLEVEIELDAPQWNAQPLSPFTLPSGYKRVGIKDFFKSI